MKKLQDVHNLKERKVLVRVDFNVPIGHAGEVESDSAFRIEKSLETINYLKNAGAKVLILSHIGREKTESLKPVADYLNKIMPIKFIPSFDPEAVLGIVNGLQIGEVAMLENLRQNSGEEKNDLRFANFLANLGDMFVNEAFAVSHRSHASIVSIPLYMESYAGFWFQKEVENLGKFLQKPEEPFVFILGGAKFETKIDLIEKFEKIANQIFIGGALANNFFKEIGFEVGKSLIDKTENVRRFFNKERISIPFDVLVKPGVHKELPRITKDDTIVDIGADTLSEWKNAVSSAKTILWNGPLGLYEEGFDFSSKELLKEISSSTAFSVVGGGDTVKLVREMGLENNISFVSTAGGAMLEYLAKGTLPGIEALSQ